jgi:hypothetical protein
MIDKYKHFLEGIDVQTLMERFITRTSITYLCTYIFEYTYISGLDILAGKCIHFFTASKIGCLLI